MEIISSDTIREKTRAAIEERHQEHTKQLIEQIEKASAEGRYEVSFHGILDKKTIAEFKEKGYKVKYNYGDFDEYGNFYDGFFTVSWKGGFFNGKSSTTSKTKKGFKKRSLWVNVGRKEKRLWKERKKEC